MAQCPKIAGATAINNTLFVNGAIDVEVGNLYQQLFKLTFGDAMNVAGATKINSTLSASGNNDFGSAMNVAGAMDVSGA